MKGRTEVRTNVHDVIAIKPNFLTSMAYHIRELKHARFWDADGNRKRAIFPLDLFSHNHIDIAKYLFSIRDD